MKKYFSFIVSYFIFVFVHEILHIIPAFLFNEYGSFKFHFYGPEVIFKTPVPERAGFHWAIISGLPNVLTLGVGYTLLFFRKNFKGCSRFTAQILFYSTIMFLLFDTFNLSIGPLIYGGDINGIVKGLDISPVFIQIIFLFILLINREMIIMKLFPTFEIKTNHILFKPLIRLKNK